MADAIECQQQKLKTCKIECRSKRAVCNIVETIGGRALSVIKDFKELKEDEQERVKQRFKEIYETAVYQNVLIDGQNLCDLKNHDADETTEYEPIDLEKKKYINDTMVGKLDDAIVRTAQKRKHYPIKYKNKLKKLSNKTVSHLARLKVKSTTSSDNEPTTNGIGVISSSQLKDRLKETESSLSVISKATTQLIQKVEEFRVCKEIYQHNQKYKSSSNINTDMCDDVTSDRKRTNSLVTTVSPKKPKQSPQMLKKFSSHKPKLKICGN